MKYTVSINEKSKTVTVILADGTKGVAKCCDTDQFNLSTGIELALERAKVAKANAEKPKVVKSSDVMELVKALEKALPAGQMVVVGNGKELTAEQKAWLHNLTDCKGQTKPTKCKRGGTCYTDEEIEEMLDKAHSDGYEEGYADGAADAEEDCDCCDCCDLEYKQCDLDDAHADGYDEGYADGYAEGKRDALSDIQDRLADLM
jgi:flagellar biosynthesis/type III secretory pathway protein FliH